VCVADPGFYSMNLMMIGKTSMRMKDKDQAINYLTKARDYPVRTEDDKKVWQVLYLHLTHLPEMVLLPTWKLCHIVLYITSGHVPLAAC